APPGRPVRPRRPRPPAARPGRRPHYPGTRPPRHPAELGAAFRQPRGGGHPAGEGTMRLQTYDPVALALIQEIHTGDLEALRRLLAEHPGLANARIEGARGGARTPLHVVTDWPGYFPNGPAAVAILVDAGADVDAPCEGGSDAETALHWAASSDDVEVAR